MSDPMVLPGQLCVIIHETNLFNEIGRPVARLQVGDLIIMLVARKRHTGSHYILSLSPDGLIGEVFTPYLEVSN